MPSASTSTFMRPSVPMSSLSHSMKVRFSMAALPMGTVSSSRSRVSTKPPTCWERWRGKPMSCRASATAWRERRVVGIEPGFPDVLVGQAVVVAAPHGLGERGGHVLGQPHGLADLADRAPRAIMNDSGADRRTVLAVAAVDVLDHLLAPLVLEIDVDVGRLVAVLRDEACEQELALVGVDLGDAEAVADRAVGGRAAPLAKDRLLQIAREGHHVVHGEEVAGVVELGDDGELVSEAPLHLLRDAIRMQMLRVALARAFPGQIRQVLLRRPARRHRLVGILVFQLVEGEAAGVGDLDRARDRLGEGLEQPRHLLGRLEVALGIDRKPQASLVDGALLADAGDDIGERPALGRVIVHVVDGDQRRAGAPAELVEQTEPAGLVAAMQVDAGEEAAPGRRAGEGCEAPGEGRRERVGRECDQHLAFAGGHDIGEGDMVLALLPLLDLDVALGQQAAEPAVGGPIDGVGDDLEAVGGDKARADQQLDGPGCASTRRRRARRRQSCCGRRCRRRQGRACRPPPPSPAGCEAPRRKEKLVVTASSA